MGQAQKEKRRLKVRLYLHLPKKKQIILFSRAATWANMQNIYRRWSHSLILEASFSCKYWKWFCQFCIATMPKYDKIYHQTESTLPPLRKLKTCFRFPLDGRAFVANLQINISRRRISNLVMGISENDFPLSNVPNRKIISKFRNQSRHRKQIF